MMGEKNPLHLWIRAEKSTSTVITVGFLIKILLPNIQFLNSKLFHSRLTPLPASWKVHYWQVLSIHVLVFFMSNAITLDKRSGSEKVMKIKVDSLHLASTSVKKNPYCSAGMSYRLPSRYQFLLVEVQNYAKLKTIQYLQRINIAESHTLNFRKRHERMRSCLQVVFKETLSAKTI